MATKNIVPNGNGEGGIGVTGKRWNTGFINTITGNLTGNVTGNTSGTAATVTGAAQSNITSLGTLTALTVDNVIVNGTTIGHTNDIDLMTLADQSLTIAGSLTVSSTVRLNSDGQSLLIFPTTTDSVRMQIQSSGGGNMIVGVDRSNGGNLSTGTTAYSTVIGSGGNKDLFLATNSIQRLKINGSTGAATFTNSAGTTNGNGINLRAGGDAASDGNVLNFTSLGGDVTASIFSDADGGSSRIKSLGPLHLHSGNIGISATNQTPHHRNGG